MARVSRFPPTPPRVTKPSPKSSDTSSSLRKKRRSSPKTDAPPVSEENSQNVESADSSAQGVLDSLLGAARLAEAEHGASSLPALPDDLDPDAAWVRASGWTPLEFLTYSYRNPWVKINDRISAARAVLEYTHRKLPQQLRMAGANGESLNLGPGGIALTPAALSALTDAELDLLRALFDKMGDFKL